MLIISLLTISSYIWDFPWVIFLLPILYSFKVPLVKNFIFFPFVLSFWERSTSVWYSLIHYNVSTCVFFFIYTASWIWEFKLFNISGKFLVILSSTIASSLVYYSPLEILKKKWILFLYLSCLNLDFILFFSLSLYCT